MKNDAFPARDCVVGDEEYFGPLPRCEMRSEIFLYDLSREGKLSLLRNISGSGVINPPLQHPATQHYNATEIRL